MLPEGIQDEIKMLLESMEEARKDRDFSDYAKLAKALLNLVEAYNFTMVIAKQTKNDYY